MSVLIQAKECLPTASGGGPTHHFSTIQALCDLLPVSLSRFISHHSSPSWILATVASFHLWTDQDSFCCRAYGSLFYLIIRSHSFSSIFSLQRTFPHLIPSPKARSSAWVHPFVKSVFIVLSRHDYFKQLSAHFPHNCQWIRLRFCLLITVFSEPRIVFDIS